jgi:hypothetical protein
VSVACREGGNDGDNDNGSGRLGAQLMPYILPPMPSSSRLGAERDKGGGNPFDEGPDEDGAGASSSGEDDDNSDTGDDHSGEYPSPSSSSRRDSSSSSSCTPLSIAVTDFHYLVLARVRSWGAESRSKIQAGGKGTELAVRREREKERGRGRGGRRSEGKLGYYLLAMSRLDGALSQCIDLTSQAHSSSIVRFKLATHIHPTAQHAPHLTVRPTDPKKKTPVEPPPPLREEGLEGTPLGLFSDPKTGCVWLYSDKALYQVPAVCLSFHLISFHFISLTET